MFAVISISEHSARHERNAHGREIAGRDAIDVRSRLLARRVTATNDFGVRMIEIKGLWKNAHRAGNDAAITRHASQNLLEEPYLPLVARV